MKNPPNWTKLPWRIANISFVILSLWGGYVSLSPERLNRTNPDVILCSIILVMMPLFSIGAVYYSVQSGNCETLRRPSWDRNPLNWWYDPLQSLSMSVWIMSATALGSLFRLPVFESTGFWTFGVYCCLSAGLAIGQFFVYKIFRDRITQV